MSLTQMDVAVKLHKFVKQCGVQSGLAIALAVMLGGLPGGGKALAQALFDTNAKRAILIDYETGSTLFAKNADQLMPPASLSKLMTIVHIFREVKAGRLKLEDKFRVSENAWRTGGFPSGTSAMGIPLNKEEVLSELLRGIIVQSGNDASIVVAEGLSGSEAGFADALTKHAREIGLTKSTFANSTGLPHPDQKMTARELALLSRHIIKNYPEEYKLFALKEFKYRKHRFFNRNPLVFSFGADGLKTGYTKESGYGLVASVKRQGRRLILVVSGLKSKKERRTEGERLFNWGFRSFKKYQLFAKGETVGEVRVVGGSVSNLPLTGKDGGGVTIYLPRILAARKLRASIVYNGPLKPPIKKGRQIAFLHLKAKNMATNIVPLYAAMDVEKAGLLWRGTDSLMFFATSWLY